MGTPSARPPLVQAPNAPWDQSQHPRAREDYDGDVETNIQEAAKNSYMNPEPGFQFGPGDFADAN